MPLKKLGELEVPSDQDYLAEVDNFTEKLIKKTLLPSSDVDDVAIVISEAVNNAMVHGNNLDVTKSVKIRLYSCSKYIRIVIQDEGGGFSPEDVPDPREDENLLKASGRGLLIIRHLMDEVSYRSVKSGTQIIMDKYV